MNKYIFSMFISLYCYPVYSVAYSTALLAHLAVGLIMPFRSKGRNLLMFALPRGHITTLAKLWCPVVAPRGSGRHVFRSNAKFASPLAQGLDRFVVPLVAGVVISSSRAYGAIWVTFVIIVGACVRPRVEACLTGTLFGIRDTIVEDAVTNSFIFRARLRAENLEFF